MAVTSFSALILLLTCLRLTSSSAMDTITATKFLKDPDTIISKSSTFTLGFFSPPNSTHRYIGIWYSKPSVKDVVWVANRNTPLNDSSGIFRLFKDGNIQLLNGKNQILWSSNVSNLEADSNFSASAQIMDSGNFILRIKDEVIWQSFDHPTNSWLPNSRLSTNKNPNENKALRSWKSLSDPSEGLFTLGIEGFILPQLVIRQGDRPHWRSGPWNGNYLIGVEFDFVDFINAQMVISTDKEATVSTTYFYPNKSLLSTYMVTTEGQMVQIWWDQGKRSWEVEWHAPVTECDVYGKCGEFGTCKPQRKPICQCLKGYEPKNKAEWSKGNWSSGCVRMKRFRCEKGQGKEDGFLRLKMMKVPDNAEWRLGLTQDGCRTQCLNNCSCLAYAYDTGVGCMTWSASVVDIQEFSVSGADLYLRLPHSVIAPNNNVKVAMAVTASLVGMAAIVALLYFLRKRRSQQQAHKNQVKLEELPLFEFDRLVAATKNFSESNKLGRGGFGTVYKGILEDEQEIAVKRLSRASGQGLDEFMNEVVVISKLQHRNLVRLLGCSVEGEEKMLVYEYMPNRSLDAFLFAEDKKRILDWNKRFNIIEGTCRGLEYLHRDSRLKIIHRDLKPSNILLDKELNPKISDFGMARILGGEQDQANTIKVVGTYGYMSPEYAMEGLFSEKSDVFSFGVLLLEIITGERNNDFSNDEELSLLGYAWKLWNEKEITSLIDPVIAKPCYEADIVRCIQVGLLCVQELAIERPCISTVISMLEGGISDLPDPNKPGFTHTSNDSDEKQGSTINFISITHVTGR